MKKNLVTKNVVLGLKPPRELLTKKPIFLTDSQISDLLKACPAHYRLLIEFLVMSGLRRGEATALQRKDLRMGINDQLVVSVTKAWKRVDGGMEIGVPKTKASVREVSLSANFSQKIIKHVKNLSGNDLVFTNP